MKLGEFSDRTPTQENAGSDAIFDFLDIKTEVTAPILENQRLEVEVWEENTTGDTLLGTASTSIKKVTTFEEEVQFKMVLKTSKGEHAGRLLLFAKLEEKPLSADQASELLIPADFKLGVAYVRRICGFGLKNTDLFGGLSKQDPYVMLKLGSWSAQTKVLDNAGTNCMWDLLDMEIDVGREAVESSAFEVQVMNKNNLRAHSLIGSGITPIRMAGVKLGEVVELTTELKDSKGNAAGRIVLYVEVKVEEDESTYALPADFQFGHFKVSRITAFNLRNTELMGLGMQDPFVVLALGDWSEQTFTKDDAGSDASWDFLSMGCDVYRDSVETQKLSVQVFDENSGRSNVLIGSAEISLMKCGAHLDEEVELKCTLLDDKQQNPAGKVVLYATVSRPEPELELPDTFKEGLLKIKRVSVFGLKNSEMFGLSKGDPYMRLQLNDFIAKTKALSNAGENPAWQHLDFETRCNVKTVKVGQLLVEAWDKNSITSDKKLSSCELPIKKAGGNLEKDVELSGVLKTDTGEDRGKVVVLAQLLPVAALSLPELQLPKDFQVGIIKFVKIQTIGLANKEWLGKQVF